MDEIYTTPHRPNSVLVFIWDVLAFAGGAGVILGVFHWLSSVLPIFQRLGLS